MKHNVVRFRVFLALFAVLGLITLFLGTRPAAAGTAREPFENINVNCVILSETVWITDDILHIRDRVMDGAVDSNRDFHEGQTRMVGNANVNMVTGYGNYWGTLAIYPDAYPDGHWYGNWSMQVTPGKVGGIARLQGFGELDGLLTKADLAPLPPPTLPDYAYLCGGNLPISGARRDRRSALPRRTSRRGRHVTAFEGGAERVARRALRLPMGRPALFPYGHAGGTPAGSVPRRARTGESGGDFAVQGDVFQEGPPQALIREGRRLRGKHRPRRGKVVDGAQDAPAGGVEAQPVAVDVGGFQEGAGFDHGGARLFRVAQGVVGQGQLQQHVGIMQAGGLPPPGHGRLQNCQSSRRISAQGVIFRSGAGPGQVGAPGLQACGLQAVEEIAGLVKPVCGQQHADQPGAVPDAIVGIGRQADLDTERHQLPHGVHGGVKLPHIGAVNAEIKEHGAVGPGVLQGAIEILQRAQLRPGLFPAPEIGIGLGQLAQGVGEFGQEGFFRPVGGQGQGATRGGAGVGAAPLGAQGKGEVAENLIEQARVAGGFGVAAGLLQMNQPLARASQGIGQVPAQRLPNARRGDRPVAADGQVKGPSGGRFDICKAGLQHAEAHLGFQRFQLRIHVAGRCGQCQQRRGIRLPGGQPHQRAAQRQAAAQQRQAQARPPPADGSRSSKALLT